MAKQGVSDENGQGGLSFNGSAESWFQILHKTNVGYPGDLYAIFGNLKPIPQVVLGLFRVVESFGDGNGEGFYQAFSVLIAPDEGEVDSLRNVLVATEAMRTSVSELDSCDLESLVAAMSDLPERSVIFVAGLDRLRGGRQVVRSASSSAIWTGGTHRILSPTARGVDQLEPIVLRLLDLAKERQLFVIATCAFPREVGDKVNNKIFQPNTFFYAGLSSDSDGSSESLEREFGRLVEQAIADPTSLDDVLKSVDKFSVENDKKSLAKAQIIFACGDYERSWLELEPYLDSYLNETPSVSLTIGHCALAAGRIEQAKKWTKLATEKRLEYFEDIHRGYLLSQELGDDKACEILLEKLVRFFPRERQVVEIRYNQAVASGRHQDASKLAENLQLDLESELWGVLAKKSIEFEELEAVYEKALKVGKDDWCASKIVAELRKRSDPDGVSYWADRVSISSTHGNEAVADKIWSFGRGLLHKESIQSSDVDEFLPLLELVAAYPGRRKARYELEDLIHGQLPEIDRIALLGATLMKLISQCPIPAGHGDDSHKVAPADPDAVLSLAKEIIVEIGSGPKILGAGVLSDDLAGRITPELMRGFLLVVENSKYSDGAVQQAHLFLVIANLMSGALKDPNSDFVAAHLIVQRLARSGELQAARNISEEILRAFPIKDDYREWRLGMSWILYSEAFSMTGNNIAALLFLCLGFSILKTQVIDGSLVCDSLRICTKVLRDVHLTRFALDALEMERDLREKIGATSLVWQLDQLKLSILIKSAPESKYPKLLGDAMRQLRDLPDGREPLPIVSLAASLVRGIRQRGVEVGGAIVAELTGALSGESGAYVQVLLRMLDRNIDKKVLLDLLDEVGNAIRREDASAQVAPIQIVSEDALEIAEEKEDVDLFLAAAALQCQPGLTLAAIDFGSDDALESRFRDQILNSVTVDPAHENIDVLMQVLGGMKSQNEYKITSCCSYGSKQLQEAMSEDEQVILLAVGARGLSLKCIFNKDETPSIVHMPRDVWGKIVTSWRRALQKLNHDTRTDRLVGIVQWLRFASLGEINQSKRLTIIPGASLFDFPYSLLGNGESLLGADSRICVAPSVGWLCSTRKHYQPDSGRWTGWIGSDLSRDPVIIEAKRVLGEIMSDYRVDLIAGRSLEPVGDAALAVFVNHGVKGSFDEIRSVTDGEDHLGSGEIARVFGDCSCVILCVCHGAASITEMGARENQGIVAALLASGVRAVVAAPWTVSVDVLEYWLPEFLDAARKGCCVGDAAFAASKAVSSRFRGTLEWARMQVYGDPLLKLQR